jgi:hypothetical protein
MSSINLSIKPKKNTNKKLIIINKLNNDKQDDLCNLTSIILILELKHIIIIQHRIISKIMIQTYLINHHYLVIYTKQKNIRNIFFI